MNSVFRPRLLGAFLTVITVASGMVACGSRTSPKGGLKGANGKIESVDHASPDAKKAGALGACQNLIPLEVPAAQLLKGASDIPAGKWKLAQLALYQTDLDDKSSFFVRANAEDGFQPEVLCNDMKREGSAGVAKTVAASGLESVETPALTSSATRRFLTVTFTDGEVTSQRTDVVADEKEKSVPGFPLSTDRVPFKSGTVVSTRQYLMPDQTLVTRILTEGNDGTGHRTKQFVHLVQQMDN